MKLKFILLSALCILLAAVMTGCGGSSDDDRSNNKFTGEYVYTSLDYEYKEYLYVDIDGNFGIGYYTLANDGYYYRTAQCYGIVFNRGHYSNAVKTYDDGYRITGIYGNFSMPYSNELWINMTETDPYTSRSVTTDTQYYREYWRSSAKTGSEDSKLPEKIKADDKSGKTCKKEKK